MISVPTVDCQICDPEKVWLEIILGINQRPDNLELDFLGEGPCLQSLGFYQHLDMICDQLGYEKRRIKIYTANLLERHSEYIVIPKHQMYELEAIKSANVVVANKTFDKDFKHFGHFIGHGNQYRLQLASYLFNRYPQHSLQTYHCNLTDDYHRIFLGIEDVMFHGNSHDEIKDCLNLLLNSPIKQDLIDSYPILVPANINITKLYPHFFVEIVNLTYFTGNVFYIDEKVWRPILMKTPFLVQGPVNTLRNLKKLGFKTFETWWDEGYSEDPADCQVDSIKSIIAKLATLSVKELEVMYQEMLPTLEHNLELMQSLSIKDFEVICDHTR